MQSGLYKCPLFSPTLGIWSQFAMMQLVPQCERFKSFFFICTCKYYSANLPVEVPDHSAWPGKCHFACVMWSHCAGQAFVQLRWCLAQTLCSEVPQPTSLTGLGAGGKYILMMKMETHHLPNAIKFSKTYSAKQHHLNEKLIRISLFQVGLLLSGITTTNYYYY